MSSSSSSSSSTSNSGSSDSGSSDSDSETSSSAEEKEESLSPVKSQIITRRKSSECKTAAKAAETEKNTSITTPTTTTTKATSSGAVRRTSASGEENVPAKKAATAVTTPPSSTIGLRRKTVPVTPQPPNRGKSQQCNTTKTPPSKKTAGANENKLPGVVEKLNVNASTTIISDESDKEPSKLTRSQVKEKEKEREKEKDKEKEKERERDKEKEKDKDKDKEKEKNKDHENDVDKDKDKDKDKEKDRDKDKEKEKDKPKPPVKQQPPRAPKQLPKRGIGAATRNATRAKSSEESELESPSISGAGSTDVSTESEADVGSDSSNSFMSQPTKNVKGKRTTTAPNLDVSRKLTRSFSTRQNQQLKLINSNSDSDDDEAEKRSSSKSPAKKANISTKNKAKKDPSLGTLGTCNFIHTFPRSISPQQQIEKKCPIEGCDSSGHLSGNLDKHFLPEACPIYHNMSASECKERASERKMRSEQREKIDTPNGTASQDSLSDLLFPPDPRDFLNKIKESRAQFRPIAVNADKVKMEKETADQDREPCLNGMVPDYDLQLFREAQAIASENIEDEIKDLVVGKGIKYITMGKYRMKVWYQSPYPDDAARLPQMYLCEFCLRYRKSQIGIKRHAKKCVWRHPPGDEIYRKGKLQVWQVDGKRYKQYCQHLCLLAKFFLDHKTLYYDVEPFLFYIMTLADVDGCHTVGYFSKEKNSFYNVSCILTLPPYQRKGYGRLLIDFSYLLTRVEGKIGSPEKPLSDLGLISYRSYWKDVLLEHLCNRNGNTLSIKDVSQEMAIYSYDIVSTLQALGMMKYWKGKHIVLKKQDVLDEYEERAKRRDNFPKIDETCLRWSPFVPTQANNSH